MSDSGSELRENNEKIVKLISLLKQERHEMNYLIERQHEEKTKIQNEIEKLSFKLTLLTKSLHQRVEAKSNYDKTIEEIDNGYLHLVKESSKLLHTLSKEVEQLEGIMDKKTDTKSDGLIEAPKSKEAMVPPKVASKTREENKEVETVLKRASQVLAETPSKEAQKHRKSSVSQESLEKHSSGSSLLSNDFDRGSTHSQEMKHFNKYIDPPPIKATRRNTDDEELQSFREAYGRAHTPNNLTPPRKFSDGRK